MPNRNENSSYYEMMDALPDLIMSGDHDDARGAQYIAEYLTQDESTPSQESENFRASTAHLAHMVDPSQPVADTSAPARLAHRLSIAAYGGIFKSAESPALSHARTKALLSAAEYDLENSPVANYGLAIIALSAPIDNSNISGRIYVNEHYKNKYSEIVAAKTKQSPRRLIAALALQTVITERSINPSWALLNSITDGRKLKNLVKGKNLKQARFPDLTM